MNMTEHTIRSLLNAYQQKKLRPSEVIEICLRTINRSQGELNSFLQVREEAIRSRALEVDSYIGNAEKLPLYGIPIAIKDNYLIKDWQCTAGSKILKGYRSPYTATSVERLEAAGAIVIGKTNLDEFAMGSSTENSAFGPVKNPWDTTRVPGGSSGGSAVAVAAGLSLGSLGTDTGGSIRQPASLCGIVGLKPTYGRVSRYGIVAYASSLDQVGPFGRTVWDVARILEVMAGYDSKDATSSKCLVPRYTDNLTNLYRGFRIGIAREWLKRGIDREVENAFQESLQVLERETNAEIVEVQLPHSRYALSAYYLIAPSEASSNLARYDGVHYGYRTQDPKDGQALYFKSRGEGFGKEVTLRIMLGTYALSAGYYDAYYLKANQVRRLIQKDFEDAFAICDCIAVPTSPTTAFRLGEKLEDPITMYLSDIFTLPVNLSGLPGISVPCGLDSKGLPIGLQLIGRPFDESTLLSVANSYEMIRGHFPISPLAKKFHDIS